MAALNESKVALPDLLPTTSYDLAYSLPLFFTSIFLAFAGAFLTLDRTRSFAPRNAALQMPNTASFDLSRRKRRLSFYLEGGLGGLLIGWAFGLHLATFLALVIPNESASAPLGHKTFLAVWVLSAIPMTILSGRFRYAALGLSGITGGISIALALVVSIHPNLLTRRIILALSASLLFLLTVLPFSRTQHASVRLAASATGAYGLTIAVALLAHVDPWANVWERLWISDGENWGSGSEHALTAAFWLILSFGCLSDWVLHRYYGGNPDEKWDTYLAEYTAALPLAPDRAGAFQPLHTTFLDRLFPWAHIGPKPSSEVVFPLVSDGKLSSSPRASLDGNAFPAEKRPTPTPFKYQNSPRLLRKTSQAPLTRIQSLANGGPKREAVKFGQLDEDDLSSDSESEGATLRNSLSTPPPPRRLSTRTSASKTLTNGSGSPRPDGSRRVTDPSSFEEEDVTASMTKREPWRPPFLERHRSQLEGPVGAVPLTPSLMHALDRVAAAQAQVSGAPPMGMPVPSVGGPPLDVTDAQSSPAGDVYLQHQRGSGGDRWESFWRDVKDKAGEGPRK
ncbi:hypothetical protein FA95DRAFT_1587368 [Auriscalpium vulgare]|uniref:Uncharacterized protein n=1 Tax=Auriscalpium vulgare TaxID=40419 RepID=A0ACB8S3Q2_9AGAM|nr:hypothetical protein FA95DRAFT_1587368 [Auriscalpium vulgare]